MNDGLQDSRAQARIPVLLITGFLGSGKTTLVNMLLADPGMRRTLVLVNEFGQISIDTDLITRQGETMVELSNGCVCCTLIEDLGTTLAGFVDRRASGELPAFERVLIETTGLANAGPIIGVLQEDERVRHTYVLDKVITTVDAVLGMKNLDLHAESVEQAALADRLVLTKLDRLGHREDVEPLARRLRTLNPSAELLRADRGRVDVHALLGGRPAHDVRPAPTSLVDGEPCRDPNCLHRHDERGHHHGSERDTHAGGGASHPPGSGRHDAHIHSIALVRDRPLTQAQLQRFRADLAALASPNLLRVKGLVHVDETPMTPVVVQGVQHLLDEPVTLPTWPSADRRTRIVFIGWKLEREPFEALLP